MKYKLVGKCGDKEVEFSNIKDAIMGDFKLYEDTGNNYIFFYNNKRLERLNNVDKALDKEIKYVANNDDEIDYLKAEIGFIDNFSNCIYTGAEKINNVANLSLGGCAECGDTDVQVYYIYDLFEEKRYKKALCKECLKEYEDSGCYKVVKLDGKGKYVCKGRKNN